MAVNLKQNDDGSMGLQGSGLADEGGFIPVSIRWDATTTDTPTFVATRPYRVKAILARVEVAGTDGSAVTAAVKKAPSGTTIASGTALHSSTINLKGTAATNQSLTLSTTSSDLTIAAGDAIGFDFTGTLTAAVGSATISLAPV